MGLIAELRPHLEAVARYETSPTLTHELSTAICAWVNGHDWWSIEQEVELPRYPGPRRGLVDFVLRRPNRPLLAIELDRTDKRKSVAKLEHAVSLGWDALWIRWGFTRQVDVPAPIYVLDLPFAHKMSMYTRARRSDAAPPQV